MKKRLDTSLLVWMNRPSLWTIGRSRILFSTEPATDFWINQARQLNKFNGHALLLPIRQDLTLTVTVRAQLHEVYDQLGIFVMSDPSCWCKAGIEYRDEQASSVCSTVTYGGFSDWAGMPISSGIHTLTLRLHRWQNEFRVEFSFNGQKFKWLREFALPFTEGVAQVGFYACSPKNSTFDAEFFDMMIESLQWEEKRNKL